MDYNELVMDDLRTTEECTDNSVPDPEVLPRICGDWLLVRPVKPAVEKIGSILLPGQMQDDVKYLNNVGRILAFGPRAFKTKTGETIDWVDGGLNVGDTVQWERFVGKRIRYKGINLALIKDVAVQMVVESAEDLDSMVNIEA